MSGSPLAVCAVILASTLALVAKTAQTPQPSVYRLEVKREGRPAEYGTAFPVFASGAEDSPTVWFITAAHVFAGDALTNAIPPGQIEWIRMYRGAQHKWSPDFASHVSVHPTWLTTGHDVAVIRVPGSGEAVAPFLRRLSLVPTGQQIRIQGYLGPNPVVHSVDTTVSFLPGHVDGLGYLIPPVTTPGMSGGPAMYGDTAFGIVRGRPRPEAGIEVDVAHVILPLSVFNSFLSDVIPAWLGSLALDSSSSSFERALNEALHLGGATAAVARQVEHARSERPPLGQPLDVAVVAGEKVIANVNVGCNERKADVVQVTLPIVKGDRIANVNAVVRDGRNLVDSRAIARQVDDKTAVVEYSVAGLPANLSTLFNCSGGGQGLVVLLYTVHRQVESIQ